MFFFQQSKDNQMSLGSFVWIVNMKIPQVKFYIKITTDGLENSQKNFRGYFFGADSVSLYTDVECRLTLMCIHVVQRTLVAMWT